MAPQSRQQGIGQAQNNLGVQYHEGQGVAKDYSEAAKWYRKAAEQNDIPAQAHLGSCYNTGEGVKEDPEGSGEMASQGCGSGLRPSPIPFWALPPPRGQGVAKDNTEAYAWLSLAARTYAPAAVNRDVLAGMMSPEQLVGGFKRTKVQRNRGQAPERRQMRPYSSHC